MAAGNSYCLGIKSNDFFLKDNKKAFILWLNVPKVTAYSPTDFTEFHRFLPYAGWDFADDADDADFFCKSSITHHDF